MDPVGVLGSDTRGGYAELWKLLLDVLEDRLTLAFNAFYYSAATQAFVTGVGSNTPRVPATALDPILDAIAKTRRDG